jgi:hypothetical protein
MVVVTRGEEDRGYLAIDALTTVMQSRATTTSAPRPSGGCCNLNEIVMKGQVLIVSNIT